jgi:hypothetical protein
MAFKIERPTYRVDSQNHTLSIGWIENNKPGNKVYKSQTFPWHPEKICFRLFMGNDPKTFARDFIKGEQFRLNYDFLTYSLRNRVVSVLSGIKSALVVNANVLFSKVQTAIQSCFKRTPVANPEKAQPKLEIPNDENNDADLDDASIHVVSEEDEEIQPFALAVEAEEEPLTSKIDSLNDQIAPIVKNICKVLSRMQLIECNALFKQKSTYQLIFNSKNFERNKAFAPLQYVRKLEEIRDGLDDLLYNRPRDIKGESARYIFQLEDALGSLNKLVEALKD